MDETRGGAAISMVVALFLDVAKVTSGNLDATSVIARMAPISHNIDQVMFWRAVTSDDPMIWSFQSIYRFESV